MTANNTGSESGAEDNTINKHEFTEIPILGIIQDLDESDKYMIDPLGEHISHGELTDGREFEIRNSVKNKQASVVIDISNEDDDYTRTILPLENVIDSVVEIVQELDDKELPDAIETSKTDDEREDSEDGVNSGENISSEESPGEWPNNATSRDKLNETQVRVIETAMKNPDVTSTGELTELAGVADKRNQYYAHDVLSTHWEERLETM